jgi:uncharacterized membrane protein YadS
VEPKRPWWWSLSRTEDYWAVWLGLGIIVFSLILYATGHAGLLARLAVRQPSGWTSLAPVVAHLGSAWLWYLVLFAAFLGIFAATVRLLGFRVTQYAPGFAIVYLASVFILILSSSRIARDDNLEAPLLALILGLAVGNLVELPSWFDTSLRTEYYIKTGIVLLGATLPLTLIVSAGPVAFLQAAIVSIATWLTIFLATTRLFKKDPELGAVLGAGGGVSAGVIWQRFPRFVIGFLGASVLMTIVAAATGAESGAEYAALDRDLITPIKTLRTWTFVFTFLCIGLTTRFRELTRFGWQPFWAFAIGVLVNVPLGYLLSNVLFRNFWLAIR